MIGWGSSIKVLICAFCFDALLILPRPLYSNFHRTRQFNFASSVISKHWHALAGMAWLHLVLCRAPPHPPTPPPHSPSSEECLQPMLTLSILLPHQAFLVLPWMNVSAFCTVLDECGVFHEDLFHRKVLRGKRDKWMGTV